MKSRSQYEIAPAHLRLEPDIEIVLRVKTSIEGLLAALAGITLKFKGSDVFLTGKPLLFSQAWDDDIPNAGEEYSGMRLANE